MENKIEHADDSSDNAKRAELAKRLSERVLHLSNIDLEIETDKGFKLPLEQVPVLGVAFAALPESVRAVVGTVTSPTLLTATDKFGNPLDPGMLQRFNDGSGLLGSFRDSHMKAVDIGQESDKAIIHLRAQITGKLNTRGPIEVRRSVSKRLNEVLDRLKEYQIAVYNYSFAVFLEPMLSENYDKDYLDTVADKISDQAILYRELYTTCYDAIEEAAPGESPERCTV